jgi:hypothetical protein
MIEGEILGLPIPGGTNKLHVNPDGKTVYDPETNVTWLADANVAATDTLGLPRCETPTAPKPCVALDGSMDYYSAQQFILKMNAYDHGAGYLGQTNWELPPVNANCPLYNCSDKGNPMGELFYKQLGFSAGEPVVEVPDIAVGPFQDLQPFPYWSCQANSIQDACEAGGPNPPPGPPAEWAFSFGTGFLGTSRLAGDHFVTVYYVGCDLPDQERCLGAPPYVLPAIAEKGGPAYIIPGTVTEESTITLTNVTGSVCLRAGYCTNAAGIVTAAAGNTTAPGQTSYFIEHQPDGSDLELNYGALLISIEGVGQRQVFPAVQANGLNSILPPTSLTASAPTFRELGFQKFSVQDAQIRFIVADTYYADNSGDFLLTLQTPSPTD